MESGLEKELGCPVYATILPSALHIVRPVGYVPVSMLSLVKNSEPYFTPSFTT